MGAMDELRQMAKEHDEVARIVEELDFIKGTFDAELPEKELEDVLKYLRIITKDTSKLKKVEAANEFKLHQIRKLASMMDLEYEEWKELEHLINHLEQLARLHSKVEVLSERLILNEKFSGLLDEIFQVLVLRAGQ